MKIVFILLLPAIFLYSCFWDKGKNPEASPKEPSSSNIEKLIVNLKNTKIGETAQGSLTISHQYEEDADVTVTLAGDGVTDESVFSLSRVGDVSPSHSFLLKKGEKKTYIYTFKPREYKFYTGVISVDIIGQAYYESGDMAHKRRLDVYVMAPGSPDGESLPGDYYLSFTGVNMYYQGGLRPEGAPVFRRRPLAVSFKNETGADVTYTLKDYNPAGEFRLIQNPGGASACAVMENRFYMASASQCDLNFIYEPGSKKERGQLYLEPDKTGLPTNRIFFLGQADPVRFLSPGETADWGRAGLNFTLEDTLLDLEGRIASGEDLTVDFDNGFDAIVNLKAPDDKGESFVVDFDQTKGFIIDERLTDCKMDGDSVFLEAGGACNIAVAFRPEEAKVYEHSFTVNSKDIGESYVYGLKGEGVSMKRPEIVSYAEIFPDGSDICNNSGAACNVFGAKVGESRWAGLTIKDNVSYSVSSLGSPFGIIQKYPGCEVGSNTLTIPAGASLCTVYIAFTPLAPGSFDWDITVGNKTYSFNGEGR